MDVKQHVWNMLGFQISYTSKLMQNKLQSHFKNAGYDVTFEQWTVLLALWIRDGRTQQELSAETKRDQTSLSRLLDNMVRKNLIVRVQNPANRRTNLIYLTHKGRELEQPLFEQAEKLNHLAVKGIDENELARFNDVLERIIDNMK
jgi:DNA-binding MarR family transcriptional regulator